MPKIEIINYSLIERLQTRDCDAFKEVFDMLHDPVLNYVVSIVNDLAEAQDIVASAFIKLWAQDLKSYETYDRVKNFIYLVAKNGAFEYLRRSKVVKRYVGEVTAQGRQYEKPDTDLVKYEEAILKDAYLMGDKFHPRTKQVFKLLYIDGITPVEASRRLGITDTTIRRIAFEIKNKIRKALNIKKR
jgi:RNA polymerase sigma factor (sigma-70 family)